MTAFLLFLLIFAVVPPCYALGATPDIFELAAGLVAKFLEQRRGASGGKVGSSPDVAAPSFLRD